MRRCVGISRGNEPDVGGDVLEGVHGVRDVLGRVRRAELHAHARAPFRHHGVAERHHVYATLWNVTNHLATNCPKKNLYLVISEQRLSMQYVIGIMVQARPKCSSIIHLPHTIN